MANKKGYGIFVLILTLSVIFGAYLGFVRFNSENKSRAVELAMDLNDLKKMAAYEKKPLAPILDEIRKLGVSAVGVFEETLPDANAAGEIYYAKGSGLLKLPNALFKQVKISPEKTYIYFPQETVKSRVADQLRCALGDGNVRQLSPAILEINAIEEELRPLGLGISGSQQAFLSAKGFAIIPRVWDDPHYNANNIEQKISGLKGYGTIIFDGERIIGFPTVIPALAAAMKNNGIKYGYIEVVKQEGDIRLRHLMGDESVRVHSVSRDELVKIEQEEALDRYLRAVRERGVRLIYLRPFLPPQITEPPIENNLKYLGQLKTKLEGAGFRLAGQETADNLRLQGWQLILLGAGVLVGAIFLLLQFVALPVWGSYLLFLAGLAGMLLIGPKYSLIMQKLLALSAAIVFPSYAVISSFSKDRLHPYHGMRDAIFLVVNILIETSLGIFLLVGLLSDSRFMSGIETFPAVKLALVLPVLIVAAFFWLKASEGKLMDRLFDLLNTKVNLSAILGGAVALLALAFLLARSGNFILPVPAFEKYFRDWLEMVLFVRPRTKEFMIGYPFLMLAAVYYLRGNRTWLWLLAAVGAIAPISVFNTFSHIHTPIMVSLVRTFNGLLLGILIGGIVLFLIDRYYKDK